MNYSVHEKSMTHTEISTQPTPTQTFQTHPLPIGVPGQPICMQPATDGRLPPPAGWSVSPAGPVDNCLLGLEYIGAVNQLLVKQRIEAIEAFTGFETNNKYEILNSMGQRVFMAVEDTCCCTRNCCGSARPFDIKILDNNMKEVMHLERPLRCECCLWFCCLQVLSADEGTRVGMISKQWSGLAKEIFTDADNFGVSFPQDMDVRTKATVLGAVFLIDFMYFENDSKDTKKEIKHITS